MTAGFTSLWGPCVRTRLLSIPARAVALVASVALLAALPVAPASAQQAPRPTKKALPPILASAASPKAKLQTPAGDFSNQPPLNNKAPKKDYARSFDAASSKVVERDERSTTYQNADGTFTAQLQTVAVNWKDASGAWRAIDNTLEAADGAWRNRSGPVSVTVPDVTGAAPLAALSGPGWSLSFSLAGGASGVKAKVNADTATYVDVAQDLDLEERVGASGVKELATLKKRPAAGDYRLLFPLALSGLTAAEADNGSVAFSDATGHVVAIAPPAWAWDAAQVPAEGDGVAVDQALVAHGDGVAIELTVAGDWLADPARAFPVTIDPTLDAGHQSLQFDAFASSPDPNGNYNGARQWANGSYVDLAGYDSYPTSQQSSYQYFDLSPVFSKNILAAEWRSFAVATTGSGFYRLWPIAQSWGDWSVTWNNRPNHTNAFVDGVATAWAWNYRDIKSWVQGWAANPSTSLGIAIDSAGQNSAVRFLATEQGNSLNSSIYVTYNTTPVPSEPTAPASGTTVMTDQPTLSSTTTTDPDGGPISYWFRMSTNPDALTGSTVNSGWISSPSWTPPPGVLIDGATYYWQVYTYDGSELVYQTTPVRKLKVDLRLGDAAVSPTDSVGPVRVNLANGNAVVHAASPAFDTVGGPMGLSYTYNSRAPEQFGLLGTYEDATNGDYVRMVRKDRQIDFNWGAGSPGPSLPTENFRVTWTGFVTVPNQSTNWYFGAAHDDGVTITVGSSVVLDTAGVSSTPEFGTPVSLGANQTVPIRIEYDEAIGSAYVQLHVAGPYNGLLPASWLSTTPPALSQGWTLSTDTGGSLAYNQLVIVGNDLVLMDPSGQPHGFSFGGATTSPVASFTWAPTEAGDGMITMSFDATLNKWLYVAHGEDGVDYFFNHAGQLERAVAVHDDLAKPASPAYAYDPATGRLRTITDPVTSHAITLVYGSDPYSPNYACPANSAAPVGALCRIQYWNGTTTDLSYGADQLARILDPGGAATDFAYAGGRLVEIRDALANDTITWSQRANDASVRTAIAYDAGGRVASVTLPAPMANEARPAHSYAYSYTLPGTTDVTMAGLASPPAGVARRVTYDAAGRAMTDRDPSGFVTTTAFNGDDQLVSAIDPAGLKTTSVYDHAKRAVEAWGPAPASCFGAAPPAGFTGEVPNGSCTNPAVPVARTAYDEGMVGLAAAYFENAELSGSPKAHATGVGDPSGALYQNWGGGAPSGIGTDAWSARFSGEVYLPNAGAYNFSAYTDDGVRIYVDDKLIGDFWTFPAGYTPSATVSGASAGWHRFRVDYHDTGGGAHLQLLWSGPGVSGGVPGANLRPRYGLVTSVTDANANRTNTEYARPEYGLATATAVDPAGLNLRSTTTYEVPGAGFHRRTERTLPKGSATKVAYEYYSATDPTPTNQCSGTALVGMLKRSTDATPATGGAIQREVVYDSSHRVVGRRVATDPRWSCVTYDARGRAISSTDSSAKTSSTNIVGLDHLTTFVDSAGATRVTGGTSDLLGRPRTYTDEQGTTTRRSYTQAGELDTTWRTFSGGTEAVLSVTAYDSAGRPQSFDDHSSSTARTTTFGYDANNGRPTTTTTPNGVVTTTGYDLSSGATATIDQARNGTGLAGWSVSRFAAGSLKTEAVTIPTAPVPSRTRTFGYDRAGRLTSVLETAGGASVTRSYAYDANTNRCSTAGTTCDGNWVYDSADRLLSSPFASAHTYDSHGNLTSATLRPGATPATAEVITYDANNRALTINDGTTTVDETVSPSGRVLRRVVRTNATGAVTEDILYGYDDGGDSPAYTRPLGGAVVTTYVAGPSGLIAVDAGGTV